MTYPAEVIVKNGKIHVDLKNLSQLSLLAMRYNKEVFKEVKNLKEVSDEKTEIDYETYFFVHEDTVYESKKFSEKVKTENKTPEKSKAKVPRKVKPESKKESK